MDKFFVGQPLECGKDLMCVSEIDFNPGENVDERVFFATIIGEVKDTVTGEVTLVTYKSLEFMLSHYTVHKKFIIIVAVVTLVLLLILAFVYFKKFKRIEKQLKLEMQDVRNVAGLNVGANLPPNASILNA
jgi:hypothetical protein